MFLNEESIKHIKNPVRLDSHFPKFDCGIIDCSQACTGSTASWITWTVVHGGYLVNPIRGIPFLEGSTGIIACVQRSLSWLSKAKWASFCV